MLTIEVTVPRALSYKGKIHLKPGPNEGISEEVFLDVWARDSIMRINFGTGDFKIQKDGADWAPGDAPKAEKVAEPMAPTPVPSAEVTRPEDVPEPEPREEQPDSEPTPVGGGSVPGTAKQAKEAVANTGDSGQLNEWLENESRATVRKAIKERLEELEYIEG
jgi:hypothetical protein